MNAEILFDYDNLTEIQKNRGIKDISYEVLRILRIRTTSDDLIRECRVRVYGGWYENEKFSKEGQEIIAKLPVGPVILNMPEPVSVTYEIAQSLLQIPRVLGSTYRRKSSPIKGVRFDSTPYPQDSNCYINIVKKVLQSGSCHNTSCLNNASCQSVVYMVQQKLVDSMITCDLLYLSSKEYGSNQCVIALISSDDDFIPPLLVSQSHGNSVSRFHTRNNSMRIQYCSNTGIKEERLIDAV